MRRRPPHRHYLLTISLFHGAEPPNRCPRTNPRRARFRPVRAAAWLRPASAGPPHPPPSPSPDGHTPPSPSPGRPPRHPREPDRGAARASSSAGDGESRRSCAARRRSWKRRATSASPARIRTSRRMAVRSTCTYMVSPLTLLRSIYRQQLHLRFGVWETEIEQEQLAGGW